MRQGARPDVAHGQETYSQELCLVRVIDEELPGWFSGEGVVSAWRSPAWRTEVFLMQHSITGS